MAKVTVFLAEGFEEIEALTVVDLLRRAGITISMVSITSKLDVIGSHGISIRADEMFSNADFEDCEMLVLPGGMPGTTNLMRHEGLQELLKEYNEQNKMIAAICAAPSILGMNEILKGKRATCYPGFEEKLIGAIYEDNNVVQDENVISSKGLGTSIDFSLRIISYFRGNEVASEISHSIQYKR